MCSSYKTKTIVLLIGSMNCTRILNLMVLIGFMVNYMLRVNFTIAIVDMVPNRKNNGSIENATDFSTSLSNDTDVSTLNTFFFL